MSAPRRDGYWSLCAVRRRSEGDMLVHVEGIEYRDARLIGLDRRAAVPAHLGERMIGFQDHKCITDIGDERYGLDGLQAIGADMHQALEGSLIERRAQRLLAGVGRTIELHRHDLLARVRMRLDLVANQIK